MTAIRILVVDDHEFFRRSILLPLEEEARFQIVGTATSGDQGVTLARNHTPDVVVMDLNMPYLSGLSSIERIMAQPRSPAILVLTGMDDSRSVLDAFTAGVHGFLRKDIISDELLISAVFTVASGGIFIDRKTFALLKAGFLANRSHLTEQEPNRVQLTSDERELLHHVALGYENEEIGRILQVAPKTISNRLSQLYLRLKVNNRVQAANFALRHGLADLSETR